MAESGPMVTATTSSTETVPPSLICIAASMACVSNGLRFFSPLRSRRPVDALMRFSTAASGTSLTRTQIFTGSLLGTEIFGGHRSVLTDQSIQGFGQGRQTFEHLLPQLAGRRSHPQQLGQPEAVRGQPGDGRVDRITGLALDAILPDPVLAPHRDQQ